MPAFTGGVLVDGTYELTKWELYTGPGGATGTTGNTKGSKVITIAADVWQGSNFYTGGGAGTYTLTCAPPSGTSIDCTVTCPGSMSGRSISPQYTITPSCAISRSTDSYGRSHA